MSPKKLVDLLDLLLKRRRSWNIDTKLKFVVGNTELCILHVTGKVECAPSEEETGYHPLKVKCFSAGIKGIYIRSFGRCLQRCIESIDMDGI